MARPARRNDELRRICGGQPIKVLVRCEACGHQWVGGIIVKGGHMPGFVCSYCGDRDPMVDHLPFK